MDRGPGASGPGAQSAPNPTTRLLLDTLRRQGELTRSELARLTGLPTSTVAEHVRTLVRRRAVLERPAVPAGARGRPSHVLALPARRGVVAVAVLRHGRRPVHGTAQCGIVTAAGDVAATRTVDVGTNPFGSVVRTLNTLLAEAEVQAGLLRQVVLGVPMPLSLGPDREPVSGNAQVVPPMAPVLGARPHLRLGAALRTPALLANDADLGALAEAAFGVGRRVEDFVYLKCATGLGAGVVRGGRLLTSGRVTAGEIAHLQVEHGAPCFCGAPRCAAAPEPAYQLGISIGAPGGHRLRLAEVRSAAARGDPDVVTGLLTYGQALGRTIATTQLVQDPACVVLEPALGEAYHPLADGILRGLQAWSTPWLPGSSRVCLAEAGPLLELRGAAAACLAGQTWDDAVR